MREDQKLFIALLVCSLWFLGWGIVGMLGGDRLGKSGIGFLIGFILGPLSLFLFAIPNAKDLRLQVKGAQN